MTARPEPVLPHFAGWQQQTTARPNAQFAFYQANRDLTAQPLHTPRPTPNGRQTPRSALLRPARPMPEDPSHVVARHA